MNRDLYIRARSVLLEARAIMKEEGLTPDEMLLAFTDFLVALALSRGGEDTVHQTMQRILLHVENWKDGKRHSGLH